MFAAGGDRLARHLFRQTPHEPHHRMLRIDMQGIGGDECLETATWWKMAPHECDCLRRSGADRRRESNIESA